MTKLLVLKEFIQKFYQKYALVLGTLFRFMVGFLTFFAANRMIGYNPHLTSHYVEVILGLILVVFPVQVLLFFAAAFVVCHIFYVSTYLAFTVAVLFLVLYFMYIKFLPKHGYVILAMPLLFAFHIPYAAPLLLGVVSTPVAAIPIAIGVFIYYLIETLITVIAASSEDTIALYQQVVSQITSHKQMMLTMVIFMVVTIIVYLLRNRKSDYSFESSIVIGAILCTLLVLLTNYIIDIRIDTAVFFGGMFVSAIIAWLIQFFYLSLNYAGVENLQFEDEEYYYYVRAVPKMNIAAANKSVKRFNSRQNDIGSGDISESDADDAE